MHMPECPEFIPEGTQMKIHVFEVYFGACGMQTLHHQPPKPPRLIITFAKGPFTKRPVTSSRNCDHPLRGGNCSFAARVWGCSVYAVGYKEQFDSYCKVSVARRFGFLVC